VSGKVPVEVWAQDECRLGLKPIGVAPNWTGHSSSLKEVV
jgi:hypothetical protein